MGGAPGGPCRYRRAAAPSPQREGGGGRAAPGVPVPRFPVAFRRWFSYFRARWLFAVFGEFGFCCGSLSGILKSPKIAPEPSGSPAWGGWDHRAPTACPTRVRAGFRRGRFVQAPLEEKINHCHQSHPFFPQFIKVKQGPRTPPTSQALLRARGHLARVPAGWVPAPLGAPVWGQWGEAGVSSPVPSQRVAPCCRRGREDFPPLMLQEGFGFLWHDPVPHPRSRWRFGAAGGAGTDGAGLAAQPHPHGTGGMGVSGTPPIAPASSQPRHRAPPVGLSRP